MNPINTTFFIYIYIYKSAIHPPPGNAVKKCFRWRIAIIYWTVSREIWGDYEIIPHRQPFTILSTTFFGAIIDSLIKNVLPPVDWVPRPKTSEVLQLDDPPPLHSPFSQPQGSYLLLSLLFAICVLLEPPWVLLDRFSSMKGTSPPGLNGPITWTRRSLSCLSASQRMKV